MLGKAAFNFELAGRVEKFFFAPASVRPLALLRVGLAIMMMAEWWSLRNSLDELFGPRGILQVELMNAVTGTSAISFAGWFESIGVPFLMVLASFYVIRWILLVTFAFGFQTGASTIGLWLTQVVLMSSGAFSVYGVDRYYHLLLFLMMFMKTDGDEPASSQARFGLRALQLCVLMTYVNAGVAKAAGESWWTGDAVWRSLHMPEFQQTTFWWLAALPFLPKMLSVGTLFIETFYLVGVWWGRLGVAWAASIISMHLGIALFLGLVNFGLTMAFVNFALFIYPRFEEKRIAL